MHGPAKIFGLAFMVVILMLTINLTGGTDREADSGTILHLKESLLWRHCNDIIARDTLLYAICEAGLMCLDPQPGWWDLDTVATVPLSHAYQHAVQLPRELMLYNNQGRVAFVFIKNPAGPYLIAEADLGTEFLDAAYRALRLYVACGFEGVKIYDIGERGHPRCTAVLAEPAHAVAVWLHNDYLYAVDDYNGIFIYDISDNELPHYLGKQLFEKQLKDLVTAGDTAWCANSEGGLVLLELSDPAAPRFIGSYETATRINAVSLSGGYVFAADVYGNYEIYHPDSSGSVSYLYRKSLMTIPQLISDYGNTYLAAVDSGGLAHVYRLHSDWSLQDVYVLGGGDRVRGLELMEKCAYLATGTDQLIRLGNISAEGPPRIDFLPARVDEITRAGNYLCMLDNNNSVIWISAPDDAGLSGNSILLPFAGSGIDLDAAISAENDLLLSLCRADSTWIYRLDPFSGGVLASATLGGMGEIVCGRIENGHFYLAHDRALNIYDLNDPANPLLLGEFPWEGRINSIILRQGEFYTAGDFGLRVHFLSGPVPGALEKVSQEGAEIFDFELFDTLAICAGGEDGIRVYNLNSGDTMELCQKVETPGFAADLGISDSLVLVADGGGVLIYKLNLRGDFPEDPAGGIPGTFRISQNAPNPFNQATLIAVDIPPAAAGRRLELAIYNLLGQRVRILADQPVSAGRHFFTWDGTNQSGRALSSGLYFYRCRVAGIDESHKMILLK